MQLFKKMFGKSDPVAEVRQCHARQDWANLLLTAKRIDMQSLDPDLRQELRSLTDQAGDALATVNLEEGAWAEQSGNVMRARQDYQLARQQACSETLRERAEQALAALEGGTSPLTDDPGRPHASATSAACNTCTETPAAKDTTDLSSLDEDSRLELLLATLPEDLAARYQAAGAEFRRAWLAIQAGEDEQALGSLDQVPSDQRDALFLYERGGLQARRGQFGAAADDLAAALALEPELLPAFETLCEVLLASGQEEQLQSTLKKFLNEGRFSGYCWSRLAQLHAQRGELEPALAAGLKALDEQVTDPSLLVLCAQLLERTERYADAEALLRRLPAGGCGGGAHPLLAEFWLRRQIHLDRALESFKGALRQEPDNPRWLLRIAQVYLAKGWRKEAAEQIEGLMRRSGLPTTLDDEIRQVADQLREE
ncbi:MAG: hypothetical protein P8Y91_04685 [Desulfuromonadales bacterium]